jgi:hypothetical protein
MERASFGDLWLNYPHPPCSHNKNNKPSDFSSLFPNLTVSVLKDREYFSLEMHFHLYGS